MYCPRCGSANTETIKFCRQCGFSLAHISGLVTGSGNTGQLPPSPMQPSMQSPMQPIAPIPLGETSAMLALRQKRILTILAMLLLPIMAAIIAEEAFNAGEVMAVFFLLIPLGVTWAIYHYKTEMRRLQEQQLQQHYAPPASLYPQVGQVGQAAQGFPAAYQAPAQLSPPTTNPLGVQASVIEDETQKLPHKR